MQWPANAISTIRVHQWLERFHHDWKDPVKAVINSENASLSRNIQPADFGQAEVRRVWRYANADPIGLCNRPAVPGRGLTGFPPARVRMVPDGATLKDASRRRAGGLWPSLTVAPSSTEGNSGRDEETAPFSRTKKHHRRPGRQRSPIVTDTTAKATSD
jgi:hypothetical protein